MIPGSRDSGSFPLMMTKSAAGSRRAQPARHNSKTVAVEKKTASDLRVSFGALAGCFIAGYFGDAGAVLEIAVGAIKVRFVPGATAAGAGVVGAGAGTAG